jgi:formylglycine-generating enzyme required for sulfatase activity
MADSPAPSPDATAEPELIGRDDKGNPIWAVAEEGADLEAAAAPTQGLVPGQAQEPNCTAGMVDTGNYCIDMTEVTNKAYNLFLAAKVSRKLQPPYCSWNPDFTPAKGFPPDNDLPVVGVDWCDARAYCQWAQKRMCGGVGGGTARLPDFTDATKNEWFNACSNGGKSQFPYGDVFDPNRCNNSSEAVMIPVGQNPACAGMIAPFDAILDMNGNVREWEDSCGSIIGGQDGCRVRGGLNRQTGIVSCATDDVVKREGIYNDVGIRCCADHLRP